MSLPRWSLSLIGIAFALIQPSYLCLASPLRLPGSDTFTQRAVPRSAPVLPLRAYDVQHYGLSMEIHPEQRTLDATMVIDLIPAEDLTSLSFDLIDLAVKAVRIGGTSHRSSHLDGILKVEGFFPKNQTVSIEIEYGGSPTVNSEGLGLWIRPSNQGGGSSADLAFSITEPDGSALIFPCNDTPADKATFTLNLTVPEGWVGASNGVLTQDIATEGGRTFTWEESHQIATYLITINAGAYDTWEEDVDGLPVVYYARPEYVGSAKIQWAETGAQLRLFEDLFGPYPFSKYGTIEAPMPFAAMEHQTLTLWRTSLFSSSANVYSITAHEAAHHWFGNLVTPQIWEDIWLNEGFATYGEALWAESEGGQSALTEFMAQTQDIYLTYQGYEAHSSLYDPNELFGVTSYDKGAAVLHLLRYVLGDEAFFQGLKLHLENRAYGNVTTDDLQIALESTSGQDLDTFFADWIYQKAPAPNLRVGFDIDKKQVQVGIVQYGSQFDGPLPLRITLKDDTTHDVTLWYTKGTPSSLYTLQSDTTIKDVAIDPDQWALAYIDEASGLPVADCATSDPCPIGDPCDSQVNGATCGDTADEGCGGCNSTSGQNAGTPWLLGALILWLRRRQNSGPSVTPIG